MYTEPRHQIHRYRPPKERLKIAMKAAASLGPAGLHGKFEEAEGVGSLTWLAEDGDEPGSPPPIQRGGPAAEEVSPPASPATTDDDDD